MSLGDHIRLMERQWDLLSKRKSRSKSFKSADLSHLHVRRPKISIEYPHRGKRYRDGILALLQNKRGEGLISRPTSDTGADVHPHKKSPPISRRNRGAAVFSVLCRAVYYVAEREGFEPSVKFDPHTRFPVVLLQPTRTSLRNGQFFLNRCSSEMAERVGFEPTVPEGTAVFETARVSHCRTSPQQPTYHVSL